MKLLVYSHDTFGLGNIRRMLTICQYLLDTVPNISILLISGSPVVHRFRLPQGLDYIKLPCIGRDTTGEVSVKYLRTNTEDTTRLRADLIFTATVNFKPDLILVDKKPYGIENELKKTLNYVKSYGLNTKLVLLLRDILDSPSKTQFEWHRWGYYQAINHYYDQVLVAGTPEIFNVIDEYQFPQVIAKKVKYCGYLRRHSGDKSPHQVRQELNLAKKEKLVVVTSGGGEDGAKLIETYLKGLSNLSDIPPFKSLVITGTEMPRTQKQQFFEFAQILPNIVIQEFAEDINSYFNVADLVVSMAGYNTVCEILSLDKKAIIVPRIKPVQEQLIRAENMAKLGLLNMINPDKLTPDLLMNSIFKQLQTSSEIPLLNLDGLPQIRHQLLTLMWEKAFTQPSHLSYPLNLLQLRQLKAV